MESNDGSSLVAAFSGEFSCANIQCAARVESKIDNEEIFMPDLYQGDDDLSFWRMSSNLFRWNSRKTRSCSGLIPRRGLSRSSSARAARSKCIAARKTHRQSPTWNRFIRLFGRIRTLPILELKRKSSKAISSSAG